MTNTLTFHYIQITCPGANPLLLRFWFSFLTCPTIHTLCLGYLLIADHNVFAAWKALCPVLCLLVNMLFQGQTWIVHFLFVAHPDLSSQNHILTSVLPKGRLFPKLPHV